MTTGANPLAHLSAELDELKAAHLYRPLRVMSTANGTRVTVDGRDVISLASNNYLGLNTHPRLVEAAADAARRFGAGSGAVRTISGHDDPPRGAGGGARRLQARRGGAHLPVRLHLQHRGHPGRGRRAGPDRLRPAQPRLDHRRHAPREGAAGDLPPQGRRPPARAPGRRAPRRAAGRPAVPGDPGRDRRRLQHGRRHRPAAGASSRRPRSTTPPSSSTTPTPRASSAATGGARVDHFDLHGRVAIQVGTLSKAMGVLGGYVAGPLALREMLIQRGRPFLFSTSHPPAVAAACLAAIRVLEEEPELIERLWANTRRFKDGLALARLRHRRLRDADHAGHGRRLRRSRSASPTGSSTRASGRRRSSSRPSPSTAPGCGRS